MKPLRATWLVALYPARWRERYGDEFEALLEDQPATPSLLFDVVRGALDAHASPQPAGAIPVRTRTPALVSAVVAVLLVVPAVTFLTSAMVRGMQPSRYQPAHVAQAVFDAFASLGPGWFWATVVIAPAVALVVSLLVIRWRLGSDAAAREDLRALALGVRRILHQPAIVLAALAFLASAAVLSFAVTHAIAG